MGPFLEDTDDENSHDIDDLDLEMPDLVPRLPVEILATTPSSTLTTKLQRAAAAQGPLQPTSDALKHPPTPSTSPAPTAIMTLSQPAGGITSSQEPSADSQTQKTALIQAKLPSARAMTPDELHAEPPPRVDSPLALTMEENPLFVPQGAPEVEAATARTTSTQAGATKVAATDNDGDDNRANGAPAPGARKVATKAEKPMDPAAQGEKKTTKRKTAAAEPKTVAPNISNAAFQKQMKDEIEKKRKAQQAMYDKHIKVQDAKRQKLDDEIRQEYKGLDTKVEAARLMAIEHEERMQDITEDYKSIKKEQEVLSENINAVDNRLEEKNKKTDQRFNTLEQEIKQTLAESQKHPTADFEQMEKKIKDQDTCIAKITEENKELKAKIKELKITAGDHDNRLEAMERKLNKFQAGMAGIFKM